MDGWVNSIVRNSETSRFQFVITLPNSDPSSMRFDSSDLGVTKKSLVNSGDFFVYVLMVFF